MCGLLAVVLGLSGLAPPMTTARPTVAFHILVEVMLFPDYLPGTR